MMPVAFRGSSRARAFPCSDRRTGAVHPQANTFREVSHAAL